MYKSKLSSNAEAVSAVKSGDAVFTATINDTPYMLIAELCKNYEKLENVMVYSTLNAYDLEVFRTKYKGHIDFSTLFLGGAERKGFTEGNIHFCSVPLSDFERYMRHIVKPRVAIISASPMDENGDFHFGPGGVLANIHAVETAEVVIVSVNRNIPVIFGHGNTVNIKDVAFVCENDFTIHELPDEPAGDIENKIASYIIERINDGDTLQIGIGAIANAVAYGLDGRRDLGVHSEMMNNSLMYLTKKGVINCSRKNFMPGKIVCAFAWGSRELYDFIDRNELIHIAPVSWVNSYGIVSSNDNLVSINGALMTDLAGQICAESVGFRQYSGTGGQLDFVLGAKGSNGGRSFFVLPSTVRTKNGHESRIRLSLPEGGIVTTPRTCVQYVVSEYGVADLYLQSSERRARELIRIAHPDFREQLSFEAKKAGLIV
jgi:4-hydroxybutyrate CoA-transferase